MPLHTHKEIGKGSRIVVWEIGESVNWFLSKLELDEDEKQRYKGFRTDQRRVHWLAYRHILKNIVGKGSTIRVRYNAHNKPYIDLSDDHISVSHSGKFAAVIISHKRPVGIDIEQIHPRLHKVADKFVSPDETGKDLAGMSSGELCLHWCAKEALYKLYGERQLDFREHIRIQSPSGLEGGFQGMICREGDERLFQLRSETIEDYCLVYVVDDPRIQAKRPF